ncbi:hypothetical protein [Vibrio tapetis]|uniref:Acyl-coenzyme A:6-aminopenicillanic acid acyl-transferase n=1 Tax=Vibrio tapetis subsp. tapetis TaxID=1671868 RepID=A0A2N8ZJI1_9VIBR|nr:hypothetical protein [Vibrio tapetis]SON52061.1 conserved exported protein of unknown function [Vibrio tapetis subsp. tapetis]
MNKSILVLSVAAALLASSAIHAADETTQTGLNGVTIDLKGSFYEPNESQMLQETTPILEFDGLSQRGGEQIVAGYKKAFNEDVMLITITEKLASIEAEYDDVGKAQIISTMGTLKSEFPELLEFYAGIGHATGHSLEQVYMAAWASDGLFAKWANAVAQDGLDALKSATDEMKGCTAIGWNNGVLGQNQDMPISLAGKGVIWKSDTLIVHAAEPFFNSMAMGRKVSTVLNTVDLFTKGALEQGVPVSGLSMAMVAKFDNAMQAKETLDSIEVNAAYSTHYSDLKGNIVTVENQLGTNVTIDGSRKGYVTHSNHPLGQEQALVDYYANGETQLFDYAIKTTLWRNEVAETHAKYSPTRDVMALKEVFSQKPLVKAPYEGNGFVTTNSVIHDLNEGCSYGTTWLPTMQEYTKVCFDK